MTLTPARDFGPKPELAWLPVEALFVDPAYQRTMESKRSVALIERMLKGFRWSAFGVVLVAPARPDGIANRYAIMDGQHRVTVARRLGIRDVPAVIIAAETVAEQAAAFLAANRDRVQVNVFALHHAQLVAGDRDAAAIARACAEAGVEIPKYPIPATHLKPNQTLAIGAIRAAIAASDTRSAANALRVIRQAFPEPGALRAHFISGIHAALKAGATVDDLVARLKTTTLNAFDRQAHHLALDRAIPKWKAVKDALASNSVKFRQEMTKSAEATPLNAPPKPPAPKPAAKKRVGLGPSQNPSPFEASAKPADTSQAEIERHIARSGVTKCPTAYVAPTEGGRAEFKARIEKPETLTEMRARQKREHTAMLRGRP
jgi:hypothetical protein